MGVKIIGSYEKEPLTFIGMCAGVSTNKMATGDLVKRAKRCFDEGHLSVFEHVKLTWVVAGVSRALTHQLVRHRHCSFTQESQRYTSTNTEDDWFVIPDSLMTIDLMREYVDTVKNVGEVYNKLIEKGVPKEDARLLLPNAAKTKIIVTMNLAEFFHFYRLRADESAQWEIRCLAEDMLASMSMLGGEWVELAEMMQEKASEKK